MIVYVGIWTQSVKTRLPHRDQPDPRYDILDRQLGNGTLNIRLPA